MRTMAENRAVLEDLRRQIEFWKNKNNKGKDVNQKQDKGGFGDNIGERVAIELAKADRTCVNIAGKSPVETDYLAIAGEKFPEVDMHVLEMFNEVTLKLEDEECSACRYALIASFFHEGKIEKELKTLKDRIQRRRSETSLTTGGGYG